VPEAIAKKPTDTQREIIYRALGVALEFRGVEPIGHTDRVAMLATCIGVELGLNDAELEALRYGAYLHDLGKFSVPSAILSETGFLSEEQWTLLRHHTQFGLELVSELSGLPQSSLDLIAFHHERFDGQGYPRGLTGLEIPLSARIFAVVDAFVAMTVDWWSGRAVSLTAALYQLWLERGVAFEPRVVDALLRSLNYTTPTNPPVRPLSRAKPKLNGLTFVNPVPRATESFVLLDREGTVQFASPGVHTELGWENPTNSSIWDCLHDEHVMTFQHAFEHCLQTGRRSQSLTILIGGDSSDWLEVQAELVYIPGEAGETGLIFVWFQTLETTKAIGSSIIDRISLFSQALTSSNAAFLVTDLDEKIVDASPAFLRQSGHSLVEVLGRTPRFLQGPKTSRNALDGLRKGIDSRKPCQAELINYRKDGTEFWVQINIDPVRDSEGEVMFFVAVQQDISELKRAQQEEQRLLEISQDAIVMTDLSGVVVRTNLAAERVLKTQKLGFTGQTFASLMHESDSGTIQNALQNSLEKNQLITLETRGQLNNHWNLWFSWNATPFMTEGHIYWVGHDITERKLVTMTLKRERDFVSSVVDTASSLVVVLNRQGQIVQFNRASEQTLGYSFDEVKNAGVWMLVSQDSQTRRIQQFLAQTDDSLTPGEISIPIKAKNGTEVFVTWTWRILRGDNGAPEFFVLTGSDITERKRNEQALIDSESRYRKLFRAADRQARELELLDQVRTALARELDGASILQVLISTLSSVLGYNHLSIYLLREDQFVLSQQLRCNDAPVSLNSVDGVMGQVLKSRQAIWFETLDDSTPAAISSDATSLVSLPLIHESRVVGVLNIETTDEELLTRDDFRVLRAASQHGNMALDRARLHSIVRDSAREYRTVVESINDVILQTDAAGQVIFVNPAWTRLTGVEAAQTRQQVIGKFIHPSDIPRVLEVRDTAIAKRESICRMELRLLTSDGGFVWVFASTHMSYQNNELSATFTVFTDINDQKVNTVKQCLNQQSETGFYTATELQVALEALIGYLGAENGFVVSTPSQSLSGGINQNQAIAVDGGNNSQFRDQAQTMLLEKADGFSSDSSVVLALNDDQFERVGYIGLSWTSNTSQIERTRLHEFLPDFAAALQRADAYQVLLEAEQSSREFLSLTLQTQEAERERIALGLHDGPAQTMVSAMRFVESTMALEHASDPLVQKNLERTVQLISTAVKQMRETIANLIPPDLEILGLKNTIRQQLEQVAREEAWDVQTQLKSLRLPRETEVALFRIFVEAINNVRRHARASQVSVKLAEENENIVLEIRDDGVGFDPKRPPKHGKHGGVGTMGMRKRAELLGFLFELESQPNLGTSVRVILPNRRAHERI
jgi:PAS domain S-box-containing protein